MPLSFPLFSLHSDELQDLVGAENRPCQE